MPAITAQLVKELRDRTSAPMMDCKKALTQTDGDIDQAIIEMRKAGQAKADKKASRTAAEGTVIITSSDEGRKTLILEVNCETDFVAKDTHFVEFANAAAEQMLAQGTDDIAAFSQSSFEGTEGTVDEARKSLIAKIGENITLRRAQLITSDTPSGQYLHGGMIGAVVTVSTDDAELAKDMAMHVAASSPLVLNPEDVSDEEIEKERSVATAQAEQSGKPAEIVAKMIEGRLGKFRNEVSLMGQAFVKDPSQKIAALLKSKGAQVQNFVRFKVGEGIEKESSDFAKEVMDQVRDSASA